MAPVGLPGGDTLWSDGFLSASWHGQPILMKKKSHFFYQRPMASVARKFGQLHYSPLPCIYLYGMTLAPYLASVTRLMTTPGDPWRGFPSYAFMWLYNIPYLYPLSVRVFFFAINYHKLTHDHTQIFEWLRDGSSAISTLLMSHGHSPLSSVGLVSPRGYISHPLPIGHPP